MIPYGRQSIDEADIKAVIEVLRSDWLTTGPMIEGFEQDFAKFVGAGCAVAVSSGTAALHASIFALGIGPGDEVILPPMTFVATANAVVFQGGTPVFVDVEADTLLLDPSQVECKITPKTRAIIAVDYAGQPCDYDRLQALAYAHNGEGIPIIADSCHAAGATYKGVPCGSIAMLTAFSFHPVKHLTTGEGGMITTADPDLAATMRRFRNHGINTDHRQRATSGSWVYDMMELGYNYRLTDIQCALGRSQLEKLPGWINKRREIAEKYDQAFVNLEGITPLKRHAYTGHAYHLYVIRIDPNQLKIDRTEAFSQLREAGIGVNVHYLPVHLHSFYRNKFGTAPGLCPVAEAAYEEILTLPIFPAMQETEIEKVIEEVSRLV